MGVGTTPAEGRLLWKMAKCHAGNFRLFFSQYSGLKYPEVFLQKIKIFAFHRLLNILCAVSADNRRLHEWEKINRKWPAWLLKHLSWIGKIVKIYEMLLKIRNVREKIAEKMYGKYPGAKHFGNEGEGRFREILSCPPPQNACCPSNAPPKFRDLAPPLDTDINVFHVDTPNK